MLYTNDIFNCKALICQTKYFDSLYSSRKCNNPCSTLCTARNTCWQSTSRTSLKYSPINKARVCTSHIEHIVTLTNVRQEFTSLLFSTQLQKTSYQLLTVATVHAYEIFKCTALQSVKLNTWIAWLLNRCNSCTTKGPFILHRNCVAVRIYQLLSAASHRSITAFHEFKFHAKLQCSNIAISVQYGTVWQSNTIAVQMNGPLCWIHTRNAPHSHMHFSISKGSWAVSW